MLNQIAEESKTQSTNPQISHRNTQPHQSQQQQQSKIHPMLQDVDWGKLNYLCNFADTNCGPRNDMETDDDDLNVDKLVSNTTFNLLAKHCTIRDRNKAYFDGSMDDAMKKKLNTMNAQCQYCFDAKWNYAVLGYNHLYICEEKHRFDILHRKYGELYKRLRQDENKWKLYISKLAKLAQRRKQQLKRHKENIKLSNKASTTRGRGRGGATRGTGRGTNNSKSTRGRGGRGGRGKTGGRGGGRNAISNTNRNKTNILRTKKKPKNKSSLTQRIDGSVGIPRSVFNPELVRANLNRRQAANRVQEARARGTKKKSSSKRNADKEEDDYDEKDDDDDSEIEVLSNPPKSKTMTKAKGRPKKTKSTTSPVTKKKKHNKKINRKFTKSNQPQRDEKRQLAVNGLNHTLRVVGLPQHGRRLDLLYKLLQQSYVFMLPHLFHVIHSVPCNPLVPLHS